MPLLKRARLTQGAFKRHFSSKKGTTPRGDRRKVYSRAVHAGRVGILYWAERSLDSYFLASLQSLRFLRIDVCPTKKCLFNGRYARICAPGHGWRVSPGNAARGRDPDSKDPLAGKHQRRQQNGVIRRPPIKGRIPPINGSTPLPFISGLSSRDRSLPFN